MIPTVLHSQPQQQGRVMYQTSDIRNGLKVEMDGYPWVVTYFQFVKPGKGTAFTRTKLKNLITGNVVDRTFRSGEKLEPADVDATNMQYLYEDGESYHFMNMETYDQIPVSEEALGDAKNWLMENMECEIMIYKGRPVSVNVPQFIEVEITCEPGVKGNTAQGGNKAATLPSGHNVNVPLFIESGTVIRIDTTKGEYTGRV